MKITRFTLNLTLVLTLMLTFIGHAAFAGEKSGKHLLNKPSPDFHLNNTAGKRQSLSHWPEKVIVINFWATWCTPCKKEIPLLNQMQQQYREDGLQIIGIALDNLTAVEKFTQFTPINYPSLLAGINAITLIQKFGNRAGILPYTVIIDRNGDIVQIASGLLTQKYLQRTIEKYL